MMRGIRGRKAQAMPVELLIMIAVLVVAGGIFIWWITDGFTKGFESITLFGGAGKDNLAKVIDSCKMKCKVGETVGGGSSAEYTEQKIDVRFGKGIVAQAACKDLESIRESSCMINGILIQDPNQIVPAGQTPPAQTPPAPTPPAPTPPAPSWRISKESECNSVQLTWASPKCNAQFGSNSVIDVTNSPAGSTTGLLVNSETTCKGLKKVWTQGWDKPIIETPCDIA